MQLNVLIIGVGLIGGSLGLALQESPMIKNIIGADLDKEVLKKAKEMGAIDEEVTIAEGTKKADIIFICVPPGAIKSILSEIKEHLRPGVIVTDVCSIKQPVMTAYNELPEDVYAIGGHPMAGAESNGIGYADRYLFENAIYILTPAPCVPEDIYILLKQLLEQTGTCIMRLDPKSHDEYVAAISHVPHITAAALVNIAAEQEENLILAAGGFKDTTRIASSNPALWLDILFNNQDLVAKKLGRLINELENMRRALVNSDYSLIQSKLIDAQDKRNSIPSMQKRIMPTFAEIICLVADHPGALGKITTILGDANINIIDIEILRVREGDGGTIRIGVENEKDALKAVEILHNYNIKSWTR